MPKLNKIETRVSDFIRHAFTPIFGFIMLLGAHSALAIMFILFYRFQPLVACAIFFGYSGLFGMAMIACMISYVKYRNHNKSVFKNDRLLN